MKEPSAQQSIRSGGRSADTKEVGRQMVW